jgi:hypothetical protein
MTHSRTGIVVGMAAAVALSGFGETSLAAPPWHFLIPFKRIESDPAKDYAVAETNGPWLIMAASFAGPGAHDDARELVLELRKEFAITAYTYEKHYDFGADQRLPGLGLNKYGEPKRMVYKNPREFDEVAVMIGDFDSADSPAAQKSLEKVKYLRPQCLDAKNGKATSQRMLGMRQFLRTVSGDPEKKAKGPMGSAFITRNPLLPEEYFVPKGIDPLVREMNQGVEYSLLDCRGKYTVRVARFMGNTVIDQKRIEAIETGRGRLESQLADAADKAHRLTMFLRSKGIEAYEFHDRQESIVTVGSFESIGQKLPDGRVVLAPAIEQIMNSFGPEKLPLGRAGAQGAEGIKPRELAGVPLDVQPLPIDVPQVSLAAQYARFPEDER